MSGILSCDLHDYLEIACLYQYQVTLVLATGDELMGTPKTTTIKQHDGVKYEVLVFCCDNGETIDVDLLMLRSMHVHTPQAKFTDINFI